MNHPHGSASSVTIRQARRHTAISTPSVSRHPRNRVGHSEQSLQVGVGGHMAAISHGEHQTHRHLPGPSLQGQALGLLLDQIQGRAIIKFQSAKMCGLDAADSGQDVKQAGVVGGTVGMEREGLHGARVPDCTEKEIIELW